jgi:MFS family permease
MVVIIYYHIFAERWGMISPVLLLDLITNCILNQGQTMGYVFSAMSIGMLLGPLLGGVVFEKGGYNEVYAMAYILIGIDIALRLLMIEKKVAKKWDRPASERSTEVALGDISESKSNNKGATDIGVGAGRLDPLQASPEPKSTPVTPEQQVVTSPDTFPNARPAVERSRYPPVITLLKSRRLLCALWGVMVRPHLRSRLKTTTDLIL